MKYITMKTVDWENIERGVPITNDNHFVRHDKNSGLIYDDRGGYIHQSNCYIENRREITWIQHNNSSISPVAARDLVLVESHDGELCLTNAYMVIWRSIRRYRVIRQKVTLDQTKVTASEIKQVSNNLAQNRNLLTTIVILVATLLI